MKIRLFAILVFAIAFGCKEKSSGVLTDDLKKTMQDYLYSSNVHNDSSKVKYRVLDVVYYDDTMRNKYLCEFTVNLKEGLATKNGVTKPRLDTTGKMKAYISKDLKTIDRLY